MMNVEYGSRFPVFEAGIRGVRVSVLADANTCGYAQSVCRLLTECGAAPRLTVYPDAELVPDESAQAIAREASAGYGYVLAVGSGTLNDLAKLAARDLGLPCGVYATAASMDGYASGVAARIAGGCKVSEVVPPPRDILVDLKIAALAPPLMTAAGCGDILGKFTCLADWRLSAVLTGEDYAKGPAARMEAARDACAAAIGEIAAGKTLGLSKLFEALILSGQAMAEAGSSRPASGSEHHISHYLEMDFLKRRKSLPLHGVKVALGTLISLELYRMLPELTRIPTQIEDLIAGLPAPERVEGWLRTLGAPVRFSEIGVSGKLLYDALLNAHALRPRYTVLTLYHERGWMPGVAEELVRRFG